MTSGSSTMFTTLVRLPMDGRSTSSDVRKETMTMKGRKFRILILFLIGIQTGWADSLDNWTLCNPVPTDIYLAGIAYGNGQFVIVGERIVTSVDCAAWRRTQLETTVPLNAVDF